MSIRNFTLSLVSAWLMVLIPIPSPALSREAPEPPVLVAALESYRSGDFDTAIRSIPSDTDAEALRAAFIRGAEEWIRAAPPSELVRRQTVAAALALELAHARLSHDSPTLVVFLDWAARVFRDNNPTDAERVWTLAAVALVERGSQPAFVSFTLFKVQGGGRWGEMFIDRALSRFPDEPRLRLAKLVWGGKSTRSGELERLSQHPVVGADALVQLAYLQLAARKFDTALRLARRASAVGAEPEPRYVGHLIAGFCLEALRRPNEAVAEYAAALRAVSYGQSASIALALLLARDNQAASAFELIDRSLTERPFGEDPWRLFSYGGYARWRTLITDLRGVIR